MAPKIDVHHHIVPPALRKAWNDHPQLSKIMKMPDWKPQDSLDFMDLYDIASSVISIGAPVSSLTPDPQTAAKLCRELNEFSADVCRQHPGRFAFLATLPSFEDADACIQESSYALTQLGAAGVLVMTSYGDRYLGHEAFQPVWAELNRLGATVALHPGMDSPVAPIAQPQPLAKPMLDWTHETTRAATHLITTGTLGRLPDCRIVLPHGGGTLPYTANRIAQIGGVLGGLGEGRTPAEFLEEARGFYFDVVFAGYREPLRALLEFARPGHVLYGSDHPFGRGALVTEQLDVMSEVLDDEELARSVYSGAAKKLFPQLA